MGAARVRAPLAGSPATRAVGVPAVGVRVLAARVLPVGVLTALALATWPAALAAQTTGAASAGRVAADPGGVAPTVSPGESPTIPARLTLADALRLAARYNPSYREAVAQVASAAAQETGSWGQFLPSLSAGLSTSGASTHSTLGTDPFGRPIQGQADFRSSNTSENIELSWELFRGGSRFADLSSARAGRRAASASARSALADARATVSTDYAQAVYDARVVTLDSALLVSARQRLAATQKLLSVGGADPSDVLGAQSDVASQQQQLESARAAALKDRLALSTEIGVSADPATFQVADTAIRVFDPSGLSADSLVAVARLSNPRLLSSEAQASAADAGVSAQRGGYWPTISAGLGYGRGVGSQNYSSLFDTGAQQRSLNFSLQVSIPLFQGLRTRAAVAQASASARVAHEQVRQQRLQLEQQVRSGLIDLRNAYRGVQLARRAAALSRRRVEMAQQQYQQGGGSFVSLQTVIDQAARTEQSALTAALTFANARADLERRVGRPIGPGS